MTSFPLRSLLLIVALASSCSSGCATLPTGTTGANADALAHEVEAWVGRAAWDQTGAVAFHFVGTRQYIWDRQAGMVLVDAGKLSVQLDLWDRGGVATRDGVALTGDALQAALDDAWQWFCNDTFWLNPLVKLFDDGVSREVVALDDGEASHRGLKVSYASGGVTPGDAYVWTIDDAGQPLSVRMWVRVLPVKGIAFRFADWTTLATGARVATSHRGPAGYDVPIRNVSGAATLAALPEASARPGLFTALVARRAGR